MTYSICFRTNSNIEDALEDDDTTEQIATKIQPPLATASPTCSREDICTSKANYKSSPSTDVDKVLAYFHKKENVTHKDDLDHFFISVCQSTRKLSRRMQNKVKKEILDIVIKAEEQDETPTSSLQHYGSLPYTQSPAQYSPSPLPSPCEDIVKHEQMITW